VRDRASPNGGGGPIEGARRVYRRAPKNLKPSPFAVPADGESLVQPGQVEFLV